MDKLKILVVDDESRMRKLVKDFLVKSNYEVLEAGDGEAARSSLPSGHDMEGPGGHAASGAGRYGSQL